MSKINGLYPRIISAIIIAIPAIGAITYGKPAFNLLLSLLGALMAWEWSKLCLKEFKISGFLLAVFVGATPLLPLAGISVLEAVKLSPVVLALLFALNFSKSGRLWFAIGAIYLCYPMAAFEYLRDIPELGFQLVLWVACMVAGTDTGGYAFGLTIGGPKLAPKISPKKTWAGLIGAMTGAFCVTLLFGLVFFEWAAPWALAGTAAILAIIAQIGDLFESHAKRTFDVKDSSNLIPGHGGVLDRLDGMMVAGVVVAALIIATKGHFLTWF